MCAKKLAREERRRRSDSILEEVLTDEAASDRETAAVVRAHAPWKEWFLQDLLRYWYGVGALAFVGLLVMAVAQEWHVRDAAGIFGLMLLAGVVAAGEYMLYRELWPHGLLKKDGTAARRARRLWRRLRWR